MIQHVTFSMFANGLYPYDFSERAITTLFNYYVSLEEDLGEQITFDPVAINCDWTEYHSIEDALFEYGGMDVDELKKSTDVLEVVNTSRVLVRNF